MTPTYLLTDKVALVTGSGRGMGREYALELARRGANVVINYVNSSAAAETVVEEIKSMGRDSIAVQADVSNPASINALFSQAIEHFGRLDIVVSNSGVGSFGHIAEITPEEFDRVINVNTRGQLFVAQVAYDHMSEGGAVVLTSSISAQAKGVARHALDSGSKAAVEAFIRCLALDFGSKRVRVNGVAPGGIKTDMATEAAHEYVPGRNGGKKFSEEELNQLLINLTPLKRVSLSEDVARVVAFLCSEDSGFLNGQIISVNGGASM